MFFICLFFCRIFLIKQILPLKKSPARHRTYINLKKTDWTRYRQEIERKQCSRYFPTDCQKDEKLFRATLLKAVSNHIPTGRHKLYTQQVPAEILALMEERDDLRKQDPASKLALINMYYAFIFPYLIYCVEVWGNALSTHTQPLIKLQNKIFMIITNSYFLASSEKIV